MEKRTGSPWRTPEGLRSRVREHWRVLCSKRRCVSMNILPPGRHPPPHSHRQTPHWSQKACGCWASPELFQTGCDWEVHRLPWDVG